MNPESIGVLQWHFGLLVVWENANAMDVTSGESVVSVVSVVTDAGSILWYAEGASQSSENPIEEEEGSCGGREDPIQPREADIEGLHFL